MTRHRCIPLPARYADHLGGGFALRGNVTRRPLFRRRSGARVSRPLGTLKCTELLTSFAKT